MLTISVDTMTKELIIKAGRIAGKARDEGKLLIQDGKLLFEVAEEIETNIRSQGAIPAFPVNLSINRDAAHYTPGINDKKAFKTGDVVKLDVGAAVDGFIADTAITIEVGTDKHKHLIDTTNNALEQSINLVQDETPVRNIGSCIEKTIKSEKLIPIVDLGGHSIEQNLLHGGVSIPNIDTGQRSKILHEGMTIAVEPFASLSGRGLTKAVEPGNIWRFICYKPQRDSKSRKLLDYLQEHHSSLPFTQRWLTEVIEDKWLNQSLKILRTSGCIESYPILRYGDIVAQFEHTMIVEKNGCLVTTR